MTRQKKLQQFSMSERNITMSVFHEHQAQRECRPVGKPGQPTPNLHLDPSRIRCQTITNRSPKSLVVRCTLATCSSCVSPYRLSTFIWTFNMADTTQATSHARLSLINYVREPQSSYFLPRAGFKPDLMSGSQL